MNSYCMKFIGDKFKYFNVLEDIVSWINELLRMLNVDMKLDFLFMNKFSYFVKKC